MRKILTVIPIRSGSQGIRNKNIRELAGMPLVAHVIHAAKKAIGVDKLIVSTDDELYAGVARKYGAEVPFIRPKELGNSSVRLHHVIAHALHYYDSRGEHFDAALSLQATVPLVKPQTIERVIDKFHQIGCQSVGTVSLIRQAHPYLAKQLAGEKGDIAMDFMCLPKNIARYPRQIRPELYYPNGSMFLRDRILLDCMDESTNCMGDAPHVVIMDDMESINIDEEIDFKVAECMVSNRLRSAS